VLLFQQATFDDDKDDDVASLKPSRSKRKLSVNAAEKDGSNQLHIVRDSAWQLSSRLSSYPPPLEQAIGGSTSVPPTSRPNEPVIRMSAWRPSFHSKTHFSSNPALDCCTFTPFEPKVGADGVVTFTRSEKNDIIFVANDWSNAMRKAKEDHRHDSGYIGRGSVKFAVYVSCTSGVQASHLQDHDVTILGTLQWD